MRDRRWMVLAGWMAVLTLLSTGCGGTQETVSAQTQIPVTQAVTETQPGAQQSQVPQVPQVSQQPTPSPEVSQQPHQSAAPTQVPTPKPTQSEQGGSSLAALSVLSLYYNQGWEMTLTQFYGTPTAAGQAALLLPRAEDPAN